MSGELEDFERRLAALDFSAQTRLRGPLRARLLARAALPQAWILAPAFALAALVLLLLLKGGAPPAPAYPRGSHGLPVLPGGFPAAAAARPQPLFAVAAGVETTTETGRTISWRLEGGAYALTTRRITPDELFERRSSL
ncbi:MAG: hypothetical protein KGM24_04560 [Elusimicrobia bacterium]|nr:hypothetical protein [Elusimicrobiota bacterium]